MAKGSLGLGRAYRGDLAVPIDVENATQTHVKGEFSRKLDLLFHDYGIAPGNWEGLAFQMALHHVPGFQVTNVERSGKIGRPGRWLGDESDALAALVSDIIAQAKTKPDQVSRRTIRGACDYIIRTGADSRFALPTGSDPKTWGKTLAKRVSAARRRQPIADVEASTTGSNAIEKHFAKPPEGTISRKP